MLLLWSTLKYIIICFYRMFDVVELKIHHGGSFEKNPRLSYINGEVEVINIDPDRISSLHLMKYIKEDRYGQVVGLYFKRVEESMEMLQLLYDNCSTLRAANLARRYGKIDIYADHGIQEAELVPNLFLPSSAPECDDGVITQPEKEVAAECENNCEADDEPIDDSDAEDSCDPFLSDDDDEVRAAMKFGTQQAEEDIDGAENSPNDEDIHGAENTDNEEGMQQNGGDNGGCEDMDQAAFGEDYDSDDPPSYHTDNEDNLNDVGDHSSKCKFPSYKCNP